MSDAVDRLIANALGAAARQAGQRSAHGRLVWRTDDGARCYERQDGADGVLTLVEPSGSTITYVIAGLGDPSCLR